MKTGKATGSKPQLTKSHKDGRPENKDNLDSRKSEEWDTKGDDITHNKKETRSQKKSAD